MSTHSPPLFMCDSVPGFESHLNVRSSLWETSLRLKWLEVDTPFTFGGRVKRCHWLPTGRTDKEDGKLKIGVRDQCILLKSQPLQQR